MALYGVVTEGPATNLATVTEYMVNGSLKQVLKRKDRYGNLFIIDLITVLLLILFYCFDRQTSDFIFLAD